MKITILGSGGGLGIPNPFCACGNCEAARRAGGKSLRNAPAVLINDDLLIDCGPDVINSVRQSGLALDGIKTLVITHRHSDHLDPWFFWARYGVSDTDLPLMKVYAPQDVLDHVFAFFEQAVGWDRAAFEAQTTTAWYPVRGGSMKLAGRYRLCFFPAAHGSDTMEAVLVGIQDAHAGYLHLYDSGPLPDATWEMIGKYRYDVAAIDATIGLQNGYESPAHLTGLQTIATAHRLRESGILKPGGVALATHFVHQAYSTHEAIAGYYEAEGLVAAYDGQVLDAGGPEPSEDDTGVMRESEQGS